MSDEDTRQTPTINSIQIRASALRKPRPSATYTRSQCEAASSHTVQRCHFPRFPQPHNRAAQRPRPCPCPLWHELLHLATEYVAPVPRLQLQSQSAEPHRAHAQARANAAERQLRVRRVRLGVLPRRHALLAEGPHVVGARVEREKLVVVLSLCVWVCEQCVRQKRGPVTRCVSYTNAIQKLLVVRCKGAKWMCTMAGSAGLAGWAGVTAVVCARSGIKGLTMGPVVTKGDSGTREGPCP